MAHLTYAAALPYAVVAYAHGAAIGGGAFQEFEPKLAEIKRIYVLPAFRGRGVAQAVLAGVGHWAQEKGYAGYLLETGRNQPEAIRLYEKCGYHPIASFAKYCGVANSLCL